MIRAQFCGTFNWNFQLHCDGAPVAEIRTGFWGERGSLYCGGTTYELISEGWWGSGYRLQRAGVTEATAVRPSWCRRRWLVRGAPHELEIRPLGLWGRDFGLFAGGPQVGRIAREGWWRRDSTLDMPDWIALPMRAFVFWIVMLSWRRAARSS